MPAGHPCAGGLWLIQYALKEESGELGSHQRTDQWFTLHPPHPATPILVLQGPEEQWCEAGRFLKPGPLGVVTGCVWHTHTSVSAWEKAVEGPC